MVIATDITAEGGREIQGIDIGGSEDETFWTRFDKEVKRRSSLLLGRLSRSAALPPAQTRSASKPVARSAS